MEYRVLGPLAILADGEPIDIGSTRQRIILAALLLDANRVVSRDRLVDALWDRHPPATASNQIHICIAALRRKLAAHGAPDVIETVSPGYLIRVDDHALDAREFELLIASGRAAAADGRPHDAVRHLVASLDLWRGSAFAGLKSDLVQVAATRLNEERLGVLEDRMDAELELGRHHDIIGELTELVAGNPLRERMCGQLMLALYRDGRQAQALAAFRAARAIFAGELGLEPSQELRHLEQAMLQNDPALQPGSLTRSRRAYVAALIPRQLPADVGDFVGREGVLGQVRAILSPQPLPEPSLPGVRHLEIVVLSGRSGVGKTALALHVAHELSDSYPDGQLFAQLEAGTELVSPAHVLEDFLRALGVTLAAPPGSVEALAQTYRSQLARRSVLVVLDDAVSVSQVIPLLPGGSSCAVIITSRSRLPGLPGAQRFEVGVFDESAGVELVTRVIGEERVRHEKDAARKLIRLCGGLPVALRIAAAKLAARPHWTVGRLVSRLGDEQQRLDELEFDEHVRGEAGGIRASISLSYESLGPDARRLLRRLAILGATDFAYWVGAPLLDLDIAIVTDLMEQLVAARLIDASVLEDQSVRFQIHELIRVYALERLMAEEPATERAAALRRVLGCWLFLAGEAHRREYGGDFTVLHGNAERWTLAGDTVSELLRDPLSWFRSERTALLLAIIKAAQAGHDELCWDLAMTSSTHFESGSFLDDWRQSCDSALDAVRRKGNRRGEAALLCSLGGLALAEQDLDEAIRCLLPAMRLFSQLQDTHGWALAARHLAYVDRQRGHYERALSHYEEALRGLRSVGDRIGEAHVLNNMAQIYLDKRREKPAEDLLDQALGICRSVSARRAAAQVEHRLGELRLSRGDFTGAEEAFESVLRAVVAGNDLVGQAYALYGLGAARMGRKLYARAEADLRAALEVSASCGDRLIHGRILLTLAELCEITRRPGFAVERLSEALEVFREVGSAPWQARALAASGRLHETAGRPAAAADAWQEGLELLGEAEAGAGLRDDLSAALAKLAPR